MHIYTYSSELHINAHPSCSGNRMLSPFRSVWLFLDTAITTSWSSLESVSIIEGQYEKLGQRWMRRFDGRASWTQGTTPKIRNIKLVTKLSKSKDKQTIYSIDVNINLAAPLLILTSRHFGDANLANNIPEQVSDCRSKDLFSNMCINSVSSALVNGVSSSLVNMSCQVSVIAKLSSLCIWKNFG